MSPKQFEKQQSDFIFHSALFPLRIACIVMEAIVLELNVTDVQLNMKEG